MRVVLWIILAISIGFICYKRYKQGKLRAVFVTLLSIIAAVYLGMSLLLFLIQPKMLYQPGSVYDFTPADYGLKYEKVSLVTLDGETIIGWFVPADGSKQTVLFCHGNAGNISNRLDTLKIFNDIGLNCLIVDYRGYGQSSGKVTEQGTLTDIRTAWHWLIKEKGLSPATIIIFGRSLGGSIAAIVAKDVHPAGLVVESTFTSFGDIGSYYYPWLPVRLFARFDYNTLDAVKQLTCPLLIIHSPEDEIVPYVFGRKIFTAANEPKQFSNLKGSHNDGVCDNVNLYKQIWQGWLKTAFPDP